MAYAYTTLRQQFLIPPTPIAVSDGYIGLESNGNQYPSNTWEDGDSLYTRFWVTGGMGVINFRFEINLQYLPDDGDYYVIDADLTSIQNELVITVTKFVNLIPYPSWRVRLNLIQYPYSKILIAPLTPEGDINNVTFSEQPYWITTIFGIEGRGREYFFIKCKNYASILRPWDIIQLFPIEPPCGMNQG